MLYGTPKHTNVSVIHVISKQFTTNGCRHDCRYGEPVALDNVVITLGAFFAVAARHLKSVTYKNKIPLKIYDKNLKSHTNLLKF